MGNSWSSAYEGWKDASLKPDRMKPPVFDPLYGFPNGRKRRKMIATDEEMNRWNLHPRDRDYCAHLLIDHLRCMDTYRPFAYYNCKEEKHAWSKCEWEDVVIRMKEYERERRLIKKEKAIEKQRSAH